MIRQIGRHLKKSLVLAGILALIAVSIWLFRKPELPLSDAFFWVGAVPVMLGTIGGFGGYMGRGDLSVQLSKTTLNQSATDRAIHEHNALEFWQASAWYWLMAGFTLCLASAHGHLHGCMGDFADRRVHTSKREWAMKAFRGIRLCVLGMVVAGCSTTTPIDKTETLDQLGHVTAGHLIACDAAQWVSAEEAIEHTMSFARAREELQHPGECGPGCMRDLESWRQGAEQGAVCRK